MPGERPLPSATVTFLFTDIEGSTRLLSELGTEAYAATLSDHRRTLRSAFAEHGGEEVDEGAGEVVWAHASSRRVASITSPGMISRRQR